MAGRAERRALSLAGFLSELTLGLERAGIADMVAGSYASSPHREPRTTQDVNLVVRCTLPALRAWFGSLPVDRWYADEDTEGDAPRRGSQFNVMDLETG